ncbi:MAG TPA: endonuclease/exonuclease/phosphatase family protein, partial [Actinomycetota bacterium]|nr:endonuclease/exonuclease/phosphatase family protein [Actinomycetota bacterium]
MPRLRVLAYNVHGFRAGARRVAEAIAGERPDVAFLNEVDYLSLRLRRFSRLVGMRWVSGLRPWRPIPNAVLVRPPWRIIEHRLVRLPRSGKLVARGALVSVVGRAGNRVTAVAVHLGLSAPERRRHAEALTDLLAGRHPVVVGGDLNELPDGPAASWLAGRYWDAFAAAGSGEGHTFPAAAPRARIDYVFVSEGIRLERA